MKHQNNKLYKAILKQILRGIIIGIIIALIFISGFILATFSFNDRWHDPKQHDYLEWQSYYNENKDCLLLWIRLTKSNATGKPIICFPRDYNL